MLLFILFLEREMVLIPLGNSLLLWLLSFLGSLNLSSALKMWGIRSHEWVLQDLVSWWSSCETHLWSTVLYDYGLSFVTAWSIFKAIDKVWHELKIAMLLSYDILPSLFDLISSILFERTSLLLLWTSQFFLHARTVGFLRALSFPPIPFYY